MPSPPIRAMPTVRRKSPAIDWFRIESDRIVDPKMVTGLKPALLEAHPLLHAAAQIRDVKDDDGLNIEALAISREPQRLLIGFRSPLLDNRAIIATLENHTAMFEVNEPARVSNALITLDMEGDGILGMSWLPVLNTYLVISGPAQASRFNSSCGSGAANQKNRPGV